MVSKNLIKFIKSLQIKKYREQSKSFLVEGEKSILELLKSNYKIDHLFISESFFEKYFPIFKQYTYQVVDLELITRISGMTNNSAGVAVVKMKPNQKININQDDYVLGLNDINNPGNLGTILRIADWFGIQKVICSTNTVDVYNPKVIQASMGSFTRVKCFYTELTSYLNGVSCNILGADLQGVPIQSISFKPPAIIILGNESHGLSNSLKSLLDQKISIPKYGEAESLNVAVAAGIICSYLRN